jgi:signal transduction histidine kinase
MFPDGFESPNLAIYEKLYGFLQILKYSSAADREVVEKLLALYKSEPDRTLSLISTMLLSTRSDENIQQLAAELEQSLNSAKVKAATIFYS